MSDDNEKLITVIIDGTEVRVPAGIMVVEAARRAGIEIPVFCYHPKLTPVGMCRMCLGEVGLPSRDRATGEVQVDEAGNPVIRWFPKLQTTCTTQVSDGMVVRMRVGTGGIRASRGAGVLAVQPSAGLPRVRQGRRMPAAGSDLLLRPGPQPLRLRGQVPL